MNVRISTFKIIYESVDQNGKDYFDSVMNPAGFFYFETNPIPEDEVLTGV